jgi:hypothetical protein
MVCPPTASGGSYEVTGTAVTVLRLARMIVAMRKCTGETCSRRLFATDHGLRDDCNQ